MVYATKASTLSWLMAVVLAGTAVGLADCVYRPLSRLSKLRDQAGSPARQAHCPATLLDDQPCGPWQQDYAAVHAEIIAGSRAPRYLTVVTSTGMSDQLVAAVSGLALAIMTDRAFILTYRMGDAKAPLSKYFCSPHIHWQHWAGMSKDLDSLDKVDCLWDSEDRDFQEPCTFSKWDQSIEVDFAEAFGDRQLVQITAKTGLLHWLFDHPKYASYLLALGLTPDNAYGCLSNYLFQATPALQKQLPGDVLETLSINTVIGIQIRLGDGVIKTGMEANYDWDTVATPWFQCAQDLEASLNISMHLVRWLLVTDSSQFKAWAKGKLGGKLFTGSHERVALFHEGVLQSAAIDNWLLGLADFQVISDLSHFGRSAALRANSDSSVFTVQQDWNLWSKAWQDGMTPIQGIERTCHVHHPDRPLDVMRAWVGV